MQITWLGNASIKIREDDSIIIIDPFIELKGGEHTNSPEMFSNAPVLITHGHIDHIGNLNQIPDLGKIYCTGTPYHTLIKKGIAESKMQLIDCNDEFEIGNFKIRVFHSKHIQFDFKLVIQTLFNRRMIQYAYNLPYIIKENRICKENNETVAYEITGKKKILLFGSLGYDSEVQYPKNVDILILPYQGNSELDQKARELVQLIMPKTVIYDHFDDAFPPISRHIQIKTIEGIENIIPVFNQIIKIGE